jgi:ribosome-binding protein aMBF1 (putative translation factor)
MTRKMGNKFNDYLKEKLKNPKIKKDFDAYDMPMRLAMAIVAAREKIGWTQTQLATKVGTSQPAIALLESGSQKNVELQTIYRIERALRPHFWFQIGAPENLEAA